MQYLSSGSIDDFSNRSNGDIHHSLVRENYLLPEPGRPAYAPVNPHSEEGGGSFQILRLLRKYWLLLLALVILGAIAGFTSVVLSSPMYQSQVLIEIQNPNVGLRNSEGGGVLETSDVDIQTQVSILQSGIFRRRGADRMQADMVPPAPAGQDIFSRLRQRIRPASQNPMEARSTGLGVAMGTFQARPVSRTRLIELNCQSTSPDVAAGFLNAMAQEFADDSRQSHVQTAQRTSEWIAVQIEETKAKVEESEEHLRDFVQASGNVFAGQDATLDDTKLAQLKGELGKIQNERIARQTRYELTLKNPPEHLAEVLDDGVLRGYQQQIETLKREKAALLTTYTEKHEKVRKSTLNSRAWV